MGGRKKCFDRWAVDHAYQETLAAEQITACQACERFFHLRRSKDEAKLR